MNENPIPAPTETDPAMLAIRWCEEAHPLLDATTLRLHAKGICCSDCLHVAEVIAKAIDGEREAREAAEARADRLVGLLRKLEWVDHTHPQRLPRAICPVCGNVKPLGHDAGCELAAELEKPL